MALRDFFRRTVPPRRPGRRAGRPRPSRRCPTGAPRGSSRRPRSRARLPRPRRRHPGHPLPRPWRRARRRPGATAAGARRRCRGTRPEAGAAAPASPGSGRDHLLDDPPPVPPRGTRHRAHPDRARAARRASRRDRPRRRPATGDGRPGRRGHAEPEPAPLRRAPASRSSPRARRPPPRPSPSAAEPEPVASRRPQRRAGAGRRSPPRPSRRRGGTPPSRQPVAERPRSRPRRPMAASRRPADPPPLAASDAAALLLALATEHLPTDVARDLLDLARPTLGLTPRDAAVVPPESSRLGGLPLLPAQRRLARARGPAAALRRPGEPRRHLRARRGAGAAALRPAQLLLPARGRPLGLRPGRPRRLAGAALRRGDGRGARGARGRRGLRRAAAGPPGDLDPAGPVLRGARPAARARRRRRRSTPWSTAYAAATGRSRHQLLGWPAEGQDPMARGRRDGGRRLPTPATGSRRRGRPARAGSCCCRSTATTPPG